jgi:hypothetical protein
MTAEDPGNRALAEILDRGGAEREADALLAAIVDTGVLVPVNDAGSVILVEDQQGRPVLPAFATEQALRGQLPSARPVPVDALRLLDIGRVTGVARMTVAADGGWATVPLGLINETLRRRGRITQQDEVVRLSRTTQPIALRLRDALARGVRGDPDIDAIWIAHARWLSTGQEQLMLHVALRDGADPRAADRLVGGVLGREVTPGPDDPAIGLRVLHAGTDRAVIAELDAIGLDTIRIDHDTNEIRVFSVDYG